MDTTQGEIINLSLISKIEINESQEAVIYIFYRKKSSLICNACPISLDPFYIVTFVQKVWPRLLGQKVCSYKTMIVLIMVLILVVYKYHGTANKIVK